MTMSFGGVPVAVRQKCSAAMTGVDPKDAASKDYAPDRFVGGRYDYVDPDDHSLDTLATGGKFEFGNDDALRIIEIRCIGNDATVTIEDTVGTYSSAVGTVTAGTIAQYGHGIVLLPSQYLKVTTTGGASVDIYVVKADYGN